MSNTFKKVFFGVMLVLAFAGIGYAQFMYSSGTKADDALIFTGEGYFYGIAIATDGTNAVTVSIYDDTSASGVLLVPTFVTTSSATDRVRSFIIYPAVHCRLGVYVDVTVAGGGTVGYVVYYIQ